jgi:hypothetical protein
LNPSADEDADLFAYLRSQLPGYKWSVVRRPQRYDLFCGFKRSHRSNFIIYVYRIDHRSRWCATFSLDSTQQITFANGQSIEQAITRLRLRVQQFQRDLLAATQPRDFGGESAEPKVDRIL